MWIERRLRQRSKIRQDRRNQRQKSVVFWQVHANSTPGVTITEWEHCGRLLADLAGKGSGNRNCSASARWRRGKREYADININKSANKCPLSFSIYCQGTIASFHTDCQPRTKSPAPASWESASLLVMNHHRQGDHFRETKAIWLWAAKGPR